MTNIDNSNIQQQPQVNSTASAIQQVKPNSLLAFSQTKPQIEIAECVEKGILIAKMGNSLDKLVDLAARWRAFIGLPKDDVSEELALAAKFIFESYDFMTYEEVELAIKLSVTRVLKDCEFNGYFSPMYVGKVLDSYLYYRKMVMAEPIRKKNIYEQHIEEEKKRPSPEKRAEDVRAFMKEFYIQFMQTGEIRDLFNIAYNFLIEHDFMQITPAQKKAAEEYGNNKVSQIRAKDADLIALEHIPIEKERWARNWCVQNFFKTIEIDELIESITPRLFYKKSPEVKAKEAREMIAGFYDEYKKTGHITDTFNRSFRLLRKLNLMQVSKEDIQAGREFGKKKVQQLVAGAKFSGAEFPTECIQDLEDKWARNWCVQNFFKTVNIDILLNNIQPSFFQ